MDTITLIDIYEGNEGNTKAEMELVEDFLNAISFSTTPTQNYHWYFEGKPLMVNLHNTSDGETWKIEISSVEDLETAIMDSFLYHYQNVIEDYGISQVEFENLANAVSIGVSESIQDNI